ncbi:hypothetical protein EJ03DRAFT_42040 [Teratosphaeria nubilosa]|uniref:Uncharacterized protein n=1 Tax=Teratosphaeria nubilosa TaxID=161662 RepID=A0A6G1KTZ5_9PEZI|nr:hypothetical protein EJ03DRAFT_42040 [Teratosphaeria nubilosa]
MQAERALKSVSACSGVFNTNGRGSCEKVHAFVAVSLDLLRDRLKCSVVSRLAHDGPGREYQTEHLREREPHAFLPLLLLLSTQHLLKLPTTFFNRPIHSSLASTSPKSENHLLALFPFPSRQEMYSQTIDPVQKSPNHIMQTPRTTLDFTPQSGDVFIMLSLLRLISIMATTKLQEEDLERACDTPSHPPSPRSGVSQPRPRVSPPGDASPRLWELAPISVQVVGWRCWDREPSVAYREEEAGNPYSTGASMSGVGFGSARR